jgi:putative flippase GtrA
MSARGLVSYAKSPTGVRLFKYSMVSVISVIVSETTLIVLVALLKWNGAGPPIVATCVGTVPSYELNRKWAWGGSGKSHFWREVVPFWVLAFIGLAFSAVTVGIADHWVRHSSYAQHRAIVDAFAYLAAFGVLWVGKFVFFNKILFAHHVEDLPEALDGRTGLPT